MSICKIFFIVVIGQYLSSTDSMPNIEKPSQIQEIRIDINNDSIDDYIQWFDENGVKSRFGYDEDGDGTFETVIDREYLQKNGIRRMIFNIDGVPFTTMEELYNDGLFRLFYPPGRYVAPFPSVTEMSLQETFDCEPSPGYGLFVFNRNRNEFEGGAVNNLSDNPWPKFFDYFTPMSYRGLVYRFFNLSFKDIDEIKPTFYNNDSQLMLLQIDASDAVGHKWGQEYVREFLITLDKTLEELARETKHEVQFLLFSDHGNNSHPTRRIDLDKYLKEDGFFVSNSLTRENAVATMPTGLINVSYIFCHDDYEPAVAQSLAKGDGVDFAVYYDEDNVIQIVSRKGKASLYVQDTNGDKKYKYISQYGDPLKLNPVIDELKKNGKLDSQGFAGDKDWYELTKSHVYPDPLYRLWRAFNGMFHFAPNILLSLEDGCHFSGDFVNFVITFNGGTHGSLKDTSTYGFCMSTETPVPEYIRAKDMVEYVEEHGLGSSRNSLSYRKDSNMDSTFAGGSK